MLFSLLLPFFRAHTYRHKFSFQKNVLVMLVFLAKSPCACASRTNLSFFENRWREFETCPCRGVSVFFSEFSDMFRMWKKWCKSWLPFSGLMWQASSEHAALAAKTWKLSWASVADEQHGNSLERFMVEAFQLFLGGRFFWMEIHLLKSTWICEKLLMFFYGFQTMGFITMGWKPQLDGGFIVSLIFTLTLGEDKIQFGSTSISSDWVEVKTTN